MESTSISATKVGIFFILGMAILAVLTFRIERFTEWWNYYDLIAYFDEAKGLEVKSDVTLAGIKVGDVKSVTVEGDKIKAVISIQKSIAIRKGSEASIISDFLLGKSHINITLASPSNPAYNAGEIIKTVESPGFIDMVSKLDNTLTGLQNMTEPLKDIQKLFDSLKDTGRALKSSIPRLNKILDSTLGIADKINSGQGTLGKLITDEALINKLNSAMEVIQKVLTNNEQSINNALAGLGDLGPQVKESLKELNSALKPLTEKGIFTNLSDASESIKNILEKIERGDGSLAKIINNNELYVELEKLVSDLRQTIQGYREQIPVGAFGSIVFSAF